MLKELEFPFDNDEIMRSKRKLLRILKEREGGIPLRIAVLGGSTTSDIVKVVELFLRDRGIIPTFYESEYAQYQRIGRVQARNRVYSYHLAQYRGTSRNKRKSRIGKFQGGTRVRAV